MKQPDLFYYAILVNYKLQSAFPLYSVISAGTHFQWLHFINKIRTNILQIKDRAISVQQNLFENLILILLFIIKILHILPVKVVQVLVQKI